MTKARLTKARLKKAPRTIALGPAVAVALVLAGCAQPAAADEDFGERARAALAGVEIPDVDVDGAAEGEVTRSYSQFLRGDDGFQTSFSPDECGDRTRSALAIAPGAEAFQVSANTEARRNYTVSMDDGADGVPAATTQYEGACAEATLQVDKGGAPITAFTYRVLPAPAALRERCAEDAADCHLRVVQTDWLALGPDAAPEPSLDPAMVLHAMEGFARVGDVNVRVAQTAESQDSLDAAEFLRVFDDAVARAGDS